MSSIYYYNSKTSFFWKAFKDDVTTFSMLYKMFSESCNVILDNSKKSYTGSYADNGDAHVTFFYLMSVCLVSCVGGSKWWWWSCPQD